MLKHITIKNLVTHFVLLTFALTLTACSFFDKDNTPQPTPLVNFRPEVIPQLLWSTKAGSGSGDEYLKMSPAIGDVAIFTASSKGTITAINKTNGRQFWQSDTRKAISTGPGIGDGIVVVCSRYGDVIALRQSDGKPIWRANVPGEILSKAAVADGIVVVKTVDGYVRALSVRDGSERWSLQQVEPNLILRGASAPLIRDRDIIVGFANGNLTKLSLTDGRMLWVQPIASPEGAFAIQRMIDIDADPILFEHRIYAATYQGKIASLDWTSGRLLWSHDISSYTGMIADANTVYISDARGHVWAFEAESGLVKWRQTELEARGVSGPANMGNYVVVGDAQGYLHWLGKADGHFAARVKVSSAVYAAPVVDNNVLYVLANNGNLRAYVLSR